MVNCTNILGFYFKIYKKNDIKLFSQIKEYFFK